MALKNLFEMAKADRYTADGREEIIKAQEAETEDKVYQIGEISQKTGLQKTANGWVKPKNGKQPGAKKPAESKPDTAKEIAEHREAAQYYKRKARSFSETDPSYGTYMKKAEEYENKAKELEGSKPGAGIPTYKESDFIGKTYGDFAKALPRGQYTITRNQENPDGSSENDFTDIKHGGKKITVKFDKDGKITSVKQHENPTRKYEIGAKNQATETKPAENKPAAGMPGKDYPVLKKEDHVKLAKEVLSNTSATDPGWTAEEIAKEWKLGKADAEEVKKEFDNLRKSSSGNKTTAGSKSAGTRHAEKRKTNRPKAIRWDRNNLNEMRGNEEYINAKAADNYYHQYGLDKIGEWKDRKGWTVKEYQNDDGETYRAKYNGEKYVGSEYDPTGEILSPENKDAAPRVLTGDTRIRVRKA